MRGGGECLWRSQESENVVLRSALLCSQHQGRGSRGASGHMQIPKPALAFPGTLTVVNSLVYCCVSQTFHKQGDSHQPHFAEGETEAQRLGAGAGTSTKLSEMQVSVALHDPNLASLMLKELNYVDSTHGREKQGAGCVFRATPSPGSIQSLRALGSRLQKRGALGPER